jgi:hypothetical protein
VGYRSFDGSAFNQPRRDHNAVIPQILAITLFWHIQVVITQRKTSWQQINICKDGANGTVCTLLISMNGLMMPGCPMMLMHQTESLSGRMNKWRNRTVRYGWQRINSAIFLAIGGNC